MLLLGYNFNSVINFVTLADTNLRIPKEQADASKYVGVFINIIDIYRVIGNDCRGFNNLSYTIQLR
jgi:hypothetical protein